MVKYNGLYRLKRYLNIIFDNVFVSPIKTINIQNNKHKTHKCQQYSKKFAIVATAYANENSRHEDILLLFIHY